MALWLKTVVVALVLPVPMILAPYAGAEDINDGLKIMVCQMLDSGMSSGQVAGELQVGFADFEAAVMDAGGTATGTWADFVGEAVIEQCPQHEGR